MKPIMEKMPLDPDWVLGTWTFDCLTVKTV
jgi:hypothetical protein